MSGQIWYCTYLIIVKRHRIVHKVANDHQGLLTLCLQIVFGHLSFLCLLLQCYTLFLQLTGIFLFLQLDGSFDNTILLVFQKTMN